MVENNLSGRIGEVHAAKVEGRNLLRLVTSPSEVVERITLWRRIVFERFEGERAS